VPWCRSGCYVKSMKKIIVQIVFIALLTSTPSFAGIYELEVTASRSDLEARYRADLPLDKGILSTGLGAIYRNDDYKIADMKLTLGKELWAPGLWLHLGLKGVVGEVERDQKKGDLTAVGVLVSARYPIPPTISPLPLGVSAGVSFAPEPLCFSDAERYIDVRTSLDFRIVKNGEILLGYRYIYARLQDNRGKWNISDATLFLGYRLSY
jgi:hypothetical protein